METKPDTIHITANAKVEIQAKRADLFIAVRGSSVVSGNEAMKKAKELQDQMMGGALGNVPLPPGLF